MNIKIEIGIDHVEIEGQKVLKPEGCASSTWQNFWEAVNRGDFENIEAIIKESEELENSLAERREEVKKLREELRNWKNGGKPSRTKHSSQRTKRY